MWPTASSGSGAQSLVREPKLVLFFFCSHFQWGSLAPCQPSFKEQSCCWVLSQTPFSPLPQEQTLWPYPVPSQGICALCQIYFGFSPAPCWWGWCWAFSEGWKRGWSNLSIYLSYPLPALRTGTAFKRRVTCPCTTQGFCGLCFETQSAGLKFLWAFHLKCQLLWPWHVLRIFFFILLFFELLKDISHAYQ